MYNLGGRVVVITGAGGVLCSMFAREIARHGRPKLALLDLNFKNAEAVAAKITAAGGTAKAYGMDATKDLGVNVTKEAEVKEIATRIEKDLGKCDILINGAGGNIPGPITEDEYFVAGREKESFFGISMDEFKAAVDLNLFGGTLIPSQIFCQQMIGRDGCSVMNVSSMCAIRPLTKVVAYSAAKASVSNFTQWLAVHLSKANIRVNALCPGFFVTTQNKDLLLNEDGTPKDRTKKITNSTPLERFGEPKELLRAVMYLIDPDNTFTTGVILPVDGGCSAYAGV